MTKKDYELFANEIHKIQPEKGEQGTDYTFDDIVALCKRVFAKDNPAFQPDKFERACYEGKHIRKAISGAV